MSMLDPEQLSRKTTIHGVRFSHTDGKPWSVEVTARLASSESLGKIVELDNGVTGYESFCLEGPSAVDVDKMKCNGWWACAGTPGRWDALYFHGLQMAKLFRKLGIILNL